MQNRLPCKIPHLSAKYIAHSRFRQSWEPFCLVSASKYKWNDDLLTVWSNPGYSSISSAFLVVQITFAVSTARNYLDFHLKSQNAVLLTSCKGLPPIEMVRNCEWRCDTYARLITTFRAIIANLEVSNTSFASLGQNELWLAEKEKH